MTIDWLARPLLLRNLRFEASSALAEKCSWYEERIQKLVLSMLTVHPSRWWTMMMVTYDNGGVGDDDDDNDDGDNDDDYNDDDGNDDVSGSVRNVFTQLHGWPSWPRLPAHTDGWLIAASLISIIIIDIIIFVILLHWSWSLWWMFKTIRPPNGL